MSLPSCYICESGSDPVRPGCACRNVWVHPACVAAFANSRQPHLRVVAWRTCMTCKHRFTSHMREALAPLWCASAPDCAHEAAIANANLADTMRLSGRFEEAIGVDRACLARLEAMETSDPVTLKIIKFISTRIGTATRTDGLIGAYARGDFVAAEAMLLVLRPTASEQQANVIDTQIAYCMMQQRRYEGAYDLLRSLYAESKRAVGERHPSSLVRRFYIAECEFEMNRGHATLDAMRAVNAEIVSVVGPMYHLSVETSLTLSRHLQAMREHDDADRLLARLYTDHVAGSRKSLEWAIGIVCTMLNGMNDARREGVTAPAIRDTVCELQSLVALASVSESGIMARYELVSESPRVLLCAARRIAELENVEPTELGELPRENRKRSHSCSRHERGRGAGHVSGIKTPKK